MHVLPLNVVQSMHGSFGIHFAAAEQQLGARVLATGQDLVSNHQFYLADRQFATAHPELLNTVVQQLNTTTQWIQQHPSQAAQLLEKPTGLSAEILQSLNFTYGLWRTTHFVQRGKNSNNRWQMLLSATTDSTKIDIQAAILTGKTAP